MSKWTKQELFELKDLYTSGFIGGDNKLNNFCVKTGRLKSNVSRKAKRLGLETKYGRDRTPEKNKAISERATSRIKLNGHPKGMLGKTHSQETKNVMSLMSKRMWDDPKSKVHSDEWKQKASDNGVKTMEKRLKSNSGNIYSKSKKGNINIGGKNVYCRSSWEANICAYFQFLKDNGSISDWELEPKTFWFLEIKRGVRSYKPDFLITENSGKQYFEEVKGWMDPKSITKLKRMAKYYPDIDIRVLGEKRYNDIKKMKALIPNWGLLG